MFELSALTAMFMGCFFGSMIGNTLYWWLRNRGRGLGSKHYCDKCGKVATQALWDSGGERMFYTCDKHSW